MSLITIVTINLNNLTGLQKTVESVVSQTFKNFEYIIIDGDSSDGSKEFIEDNYKNFNVHIIEKDNGVYDAMNKGIKIAKSQYLLFLNSGDYFVDNNVLEKIFSICRHSDIIYGNVILDDHGKQISLHYPDILSFEHFITKELPHQATFIKRDLFNKIGFYDVGFKIIADWKFFILAVLKYNCSYEHINVDVTVCDRDGISCNPQNFTLISKERNQVLQQHFSSFLIDYNNLLNARLDVVSLSKQLATVKKTFGYRLQRTIMKIFNK